MEQTYFEWLNTSTPTRWWHDSANPDEIERGIERGALGVTTNPVLTYRTFLTDPDFWKDEVDKIPDDLSPEENAEALLRLVATYAAGKFTDVFEKTGGIHGLALGQLNPDRAGDAEGMLAQARRVHSWGDNIAVKLPTTNAGLEVIESLAEECIPICATLNVSVAQAIDVAEAYEKGAAKAKAEGRKPALCLVVQQVGRLDDYLRDVAKDMKAEVLESDIQQAGIAMCKRTYKIFRERNYSSYIMPAGLRNIEQVTEMAGGEKITFTLQPRIQDMVLAANPEKVVKIDNPVAEDVIERLMTIPEFVRAYEPNAFKREEYIRFGVMQKLLSQFMETGWAPLETYGSALKSSRWF
ncbi:MAG TPA: hypothetical protein GXZ76_00935 [Clostridiaceae bacterium]|nr:hypothetical protein [Clostridiaceae bacterium]